MPSFVLLKQTQHNLLQTGTAGEKIQTHCQYPHSQTNVIQINAPEYDTDIYGQLNIQVPSHADNTQESAPVTTNSDQDSMLPQDSNWFEPQPEPDQSPAEHQTLRYSSMVLFI